MKFVIGFLFVFFSMTLHADISKYFKKCENKSDIHKLRNIDFVYLINLDKRPDRWKSCMDQLHPYGIYPYRFSAVNGYSFRLEELDEMGVKLSRSMKTKTKGIYYTLNDQGVPEAHQESMKKIGRTYFGASLGNIGCVLSHLSILQDAYDSGYETIWVLEDDLEVLQNPWLLPELIDELDQLIGKSHWDILFTDVDKRDSKDVYMRCRSLNFFRPNYHHPHLVYFLLDRKINENFRRITSRCGTHSMIVRRSGMKKILDFVKQLKIFLPIDHEVCFVKDIHLYALCEDIVSNAIGSGSDTTAADDLFEAPR